MDSTLDGARQAGPPEPGRFPVLALPPAAGCSTPVASKTQPHRSRRNSFLALSLLTLLSVLAARGFAAQHTAPNISPTSAGSDRRAVSARGGTGSLVRAAVPHTSLSETAAPAAEAAPRQPQTYTVQAGDTVWGLAVRFAVSPDTILSANSALAGNPDMLQLGQQLTILPISGVLHTVAAGDTLAGIAKRYDADAASIAAYADNKLQEPYTLQAGQKVFVPGGTLPVTSTAPTWSAAATGSIQAAASGSFMWPTSGTITQYYWAQHGAIDIGTPTGTPIIAADAGKVIVAGWSTVGYGNYVIIDHGNGYRTLYAHMSVIIATQGQSVNKGQRIGLIGSTGRSTGPHLHFEIYRNGVLQNPLNYLP